MKIFLDMVGCRLNQSEVENFANNFRALGHQIVANPAISDIAIINTCAVTVKAAADSRKKLRRAARKGAKKVVATGCWASLYPEDALNLVGVTDAVSNQEKEDLVSIILDVDPSILSELRLVRAPLPGDRARTRAFIKVQEGCDNYCTYCLTRLARGKSKSRSIEAIHRDIQAAIAGGAKEIVLTGVQLGAWGKDFIKPQALTDLLSGVLSMDGYERIRLSSIEPWDFPLTMLSFWQDARLCRHLHIPLQSGHDEVLQAMGRPITRDQYTELVEALRSGIPDLALTTDVIVGFPGETEEAFIETQDFLETMAFSGGHVFTYSPRPGTAAYSMKRQVPIEVAKARNAALRKTFKELGRHYRDRFIGSQISVLWESSHQVEEGVYRLSGLTDTYIRVYARSKKDLWNTLTNVDLDAHHSRGNGLKGNISKQD